MLDNITDCEPTTSSIKTNDYHINLPLYVLDVVRKFQDHPKYSSGLKQSDILAMLEKESFANGDVESQIKTTLIDLTSKGFIRFMNPGYRTLGPFAKLANARTPRQFIATWNRLAELQKVNCITLNSSFSTTRSTNC